MEETAPPLRSSSSTSGLWVLAGVLVGGSLVAWTRAQALSATTVTLLALAVPPGLLMVDLLPWLVLRGRRWRGLSWPATLGVGASRWIQFFVGFWAGAALVLFGSG